MYTIFLSKPKKINLYFILKNMKIDLSSYKKANDEETNDNILSINEDIDERNIEQMQMINKEEKEIYISPEEQFKNYQNYYCFRIFGILFCKMGNILTCNFDKKNNNSPKICIGPHWYLAIVTNFLISVLVTSMYFFLIESNSSFWQKLIYLCLSFMVYYFFNKCAVINPGIVQNKKMDKDNNYFCLRCQVYYNPNNKVEHCDMCGICVEKMDHHCIWVGKCVGKNNCFSFYAMLVSIGLIYAYIIFIAIWQYKSKTKKISNNISS